MVEFINTKDTLNQGRKKINESIDNSNKASSDSKNALNVSNQAVNIAKTSNDKSNDTQKQLDNIIIESGTSDAEVVQARGDEELLKYRLDKSDERLMDTAKLTKNAEFPLKITTYEGSGQTTHPSVVYLDTKWNGYHYWMAHTPYPYSNDKFENPSLLASVDGVNWITPSGVTNPIDIPTSEEYALGGFMSDPHLLFDPVIGAMECWYRLRLKTSKVEWILRKTTNDGGKTWTAREIKLDSSVSGNFYLSPSILRENGKYKMWFVGSGNQVYYTESVTGVVGTWSEFVIVPITYRSDSFTPWHLEVFKDKGRYRLLLNAFRGFRTDTTQRVLVLGDSANGLSFEDTHLLLEPSTALGSWDNNFLYRSSMIKIGERYRLYYSSMSLEGVWRVGMVEGETLETLNSVPYINSEGALELDKVSAKKIQVEREIFFYEKGVGAGRIKIDPSNGAISFETEQGNPAIIKAGNAEVEKLTAKETTLTTLNVIQIKKETLLAMPAQIQLSRTGSTTPYIKLLDSGRAGAGLVVGSRPDSLQVVNDANAKEALFEVAGVIFKQGVTVPSVEGAIKFNNITKKHEAYDGTRWHNLY